MACCIKSIAIRRPNNSPAIRVNLLIIEQAPRMASKKSKMDVHTHTLYKYYFGGRKKSSVSSANWHFFRNFNICKMFRSYHPVQAKKSSCPKSFRSLAKLNINVYINTVGSATPSMSRGCPPTTEWITPQIAVDARVCTAVKVPSVNINICTLLSKLLENRKPKKREKTKVLFDLYFFPAAPQKI